MSSRGKEFLMRSYYDERTGVRRQKSLGPKNSHTQGAKRAFTDGRQAARQGLQSAQETLKRQAAINRALKLGRIPEITARIIRALDRSHLLGSGIRVVGTNALYAYEAAAGVAFDAAMITTEDIDLLFDARASVNLAAAEDIQERTVLGLLKQIDGTFERTSQTFKARNRDGYIVDLIKPMRNPPWQTEQDALSSHQSDLRAVEIEGLAWAESAPAFKTVALDVRGFPLKITTIDPRAFAVYKLWLSKRSNREPVKRRRDAAQAKAVGRLTAQHFHHLPFSENELRMFPKAVVKDAARLFEAPEEDPLSFGI